MRKIVYLVLCLTLTACVTPKSLSNSANANLKTHQIITVGLENNVARQLNLESVTSFYQQNIEPKDGINNTAFNQCLQTALNKKFYHSALLGSVQNYLANASQTQIQADIAILQDDDTVKMGQLFQEKLKVYASDISNDEKEHYFDNDFSKKYQQYEANAQAKKKAGFNYQFSESFGRYFGENSEYDKAIVNQAKECQGVIK